MLRTRHVKLRLFIEKIELPIDGCTVNTSVQTTASITLLPTKESLDLKAGSNVIVAFKNPDSNTPMTGATGSVDDKYNIMFMGQVVSVTLDRQSASRSLVLNCTGHDELLNRAYLYNYRVNSDLASINSSFVGASKLFDSVVGKGLDLDGVIHEIMTTDATHDLHLPGFENRTEEVGGVLRLVLGLIERTLGHQHASADKRSVGAINDYFAVENTLKRLTHQIDAIPTDEYINTFLGTAVANKVLMNSASHLPETDTAYLYIKTILREFYYKMSPVGCPFPKFTQDLGRVKTVDEILREMYEVVGSHDPVNDTLSVERWVKNTIFFASANNDGPEVLTELYYDEQARDLSEKLDTNLLSLVPLGEEIDLRFKTAFSWSGPFSLSDVQENCLQYLSSEFIDRFLPSADTKEERKKADALLSYAQSEFSVLIDQVFNLRAYSYKQPIVFRASPYIVHSQTLPVRYSYDRSVVKHDWWTNIKQVGRFYHLAALDDPNFVKNTNARIREFLRRIAQKLFEQNQKDTREDFLRAINFLLVPNLFFAAPPTCNVLFPNQIGSYGTIEARYNAPTRLMLTVIPTPEEGQETGDGNSPTEAKKNTELVPKRYYAPSSEIFSNYQGESITSEFQVLSHEKFTGVVPIFREISYLTAQRAGAIDGTHKHNEELFMRIANFELMIRRYEDNKMSVSGPFNPYPVVGLPCTIIDTDDLGDDLTIYIGLLESISHTISSTQTSTSYTLTHVREVDEVDDIFEDASFLRTSGKSPSNDAPHDNSISSSVRVAVFNDSAHLLAVYTDITINMRDQIRGFLAALTNSNGSDDNVRSKALSESVRSFLDKGSLLNRTEKTITTSKGAFTLVSPAPTLKSRRTPELFNGVPSDKILNVDTRLNLAKDDNSILSFWVWVASEYSESMVNENAFISQLASESKLSSVGSLDGWKSSVNAIKKILQRDAFVEFKLKTKSDTGLAQFLRGGALKEYVGQSLEFMTSVQGILAQEMVIVGLLDLYLLHKDAREKGTPPAYHAIDVYFKDLSENTDTLVEYPLAQEEWFRPSWWGDQFSVLNIGKDVYEKLIGITSVNNAAAGVDHDVAARNSNGNLQTLVSTKKALLSAYSIYSGRNADKEGYVNSYVSRNLVTLTDILGEEGLYSSSTRVQVADQSACKGTKSNTPSTQTKRPMIDAKEIEAIRQSRVKSYESSVRKDAFK